MTETPNETPNETPMVSTDVLVESVGAPDTKRRPRTVIAVVAAAVVLAGAGVAYGAVRLSGGGTQPVELVPSSAMAVVSVDLDPSAAQKVDALRFARRFPDLKKQIGSGDDLREAVLRLLSNGDEDLSSWVPQVRPWLGDRVAIAVLPGSDELADPVVLVVLAVKDEARAQAFVATTTAKRACRLVDGFAMCTQNEATLAQAVKAADSGSLADDAVYRRDMRSVGGSGVVHAWADSARLKAALADDIDGTTTGLALNGVVGDRIKGRCAATLGFDGAQVQLRAQVLGGAAVTTTGNARVQDLPSDAAVVVGVGSADDLVTQVLNGARSIGGDREQFDQQLSTLGALTGLTLPGDLTSAVGKDLSIAVAPRAAGASGAGSGGAPAPSVAIRVGGTKAAVDKLLRAGTGVGRRADALTSTSTDHGTVISNDKAWAGRIAAGGDLGDSDRFRAVVPDASTARVVLYLDLTRVGSLFTSLSSSTVPGLSRFAGAPRPDGRSGAGVEARKAPAVLDHLAAFGLTVRQDDRSTSVQMRLSSR